MACSTALLIGLPNSTTTCTALQNEGLNLALDRLFVDTSFFIARFNRSDEHYERARDFDLIFAEARELWTTGAVLLEIAAGFADPRSRAHAVQIWDQLNGGDPRFHVVPASSDELDAAMQLYRQRPDKSWSLVDCLSFLVMQQQQISEALTTDRHFQQAGFRALLIE